MTLKGKRLLEKVIPEWEKAMNEMNTLLGKDGQQAFDAIYETITN